MKFFLAGLSVASSLMFFANNADAFSYCNTPGSCDFAIAYEATDLPDARLVKTSGSTIINF